MSDPPPPESGVNAAGVNPDGEGSFGPPLIRKTMVADALLDKDERARMGLPTADDAPLDVVVELNLANAGGLREAVATFLAHWDVIVPDAPAPMRVADTYFQCRMSVDQVRALVARDLVIEDASGRAIYRVWPDFPIQPLIYASRTTVKADAASRSYDATGRGIIWAVVDSGISKEHPHFSKRGTLTGEVENLHRDFTVAGEPPVDSALVDEFGHGTHVAGIIAGGLEDGADYRVWERVWDPSTNTSIRRSREVASAAQLSGIAPDTKLVSLKVLDAQGKGSSMNVLRALEYIRKDVNGQSKLMRVHGANLSVGYEFDAKWFACGQSPLCVEVDRLVRSGVVVVVAAGNTGYGSLSAFQRSTNVGLSMTINDPGNANLAITVGATHRDMPHTYGVSYFSSKGPTGDGRLKPDLVAPGECITSCAAGAALAKAYPPPDVVPEGTAVYVEDSGTSMAAPHVAGGVAAFLAIRREFIGQPERVKQIFLEAATSLSRERYFQGNGLVDLMRAIQSI